MQITFNATSQATMLRLKFDVPTQGCTATSMQWGAWGGTGMAVAHNLLPRILKSGLGVLAPTAGLAALALTLQQASGLHAGPLPAQIVVSPFDWTRLMAGAKHVFPLFSEFGRYKLAALPAARAGHPARKPEAAVVPAIHAGPARGVLAEVLTTVQRMLGHAIDQDQVTTRIAWHQ